MEKLQIVLQKLRLESYNATIQTEIIHEKEWHQIKWKDEFGMMIVCPGGCVCQAVLAPEAKLRKSKQVSSGL